jgi:valyl-tRNA synthetase
MENIRPWCISRQLWWGHRIPVWYCQDCGEQTCTLEDATECAHCGSARIEQDPDVLDTWFSSGLWPFSTLGWPEETADFQRFYPTDMRETAYDILFFWVAREMMLGVEMTGKTPYATVYLHGLLRNEQGKKISKSMENIKQYDPLNIIEEIGTDALRYTLLTSSTAGNDMNLDPRRLESARNFANKIWNAARFVVTNLKDGTVDGPYTAPTLADRWILSRLNHLTAEVTELFDSFQYGEAGRRINDFFWNEFCDWYIEACKIRLYGEDLAAKSTAQATLVLVLEHALRLLHPYMPFVTEEIWQHLKAVLPKGRLWGESLMITPWPKAEHVQIDDEAEGDMNLLIALIRQIRNARADYDVTPGKRIPAIIVGGEKTGMLEAQRSLLTFLAKVEETQLTLTRTLSEKPRKAVALVAAEGVGAFLPLAGLVDLEQEMARLKKAMAETQNEITQAEAMLGNERFLTKAPSLVVQQQRDRLAGAQERLGRLEERQQALES